MPDLLPTLEAYCSRSFLTGHLGPQPDFTGATRLSFWTMSSCSVYAMLTLMAFGTYLSWLPGSSYTLLIPTA